MGGPRSGARTLRAVTAEPATILSVCVRDVATGAVLARVEGDRVHRTASVGKVLLLLAVASRLAAGRLGDDALVDRRRVPPVADSGLWQHLRIDALPVADLAALVGAVSDNLATNALLELIPLAEIDQLAADLGLEVTRLHDRVRDVRGPQDPPTLSSGTADEWCDLFSALAGGQPAQPGLPPAVADRVLGWLALDTDLSMAAAAFGLDPLAHTGADRGLRLAHKTGTDAGVRADVGVLTGPVRTVAYAVLAEFAEDDTWPSQRDVVLANMREWGGRIARWALVP